MSPSNSWVWIRRTSVTAALASQTFGCSHDQPAKAPSNSLSTVEVAPRKAPRREPVEPSSILVSDTLRTKCNLPETKAESPQFDFDEATLRPRGMNILDTIATCVTTGALKGQGLRIIGHADARGSTEYNRALGIRRANSTHEYLAEKGVASNQMTVSSRGEAEATGYSESAFQLDRRVEIDEMAAIQ